MVSSASAYFDIHYFGLAYRQVENGNIHTYRIVNHRKSRLMEPNDADTSARFDCSFHIRADWCSYWNFVCSLHQFPKIITPLLDLMQTMPAFVYLLPAVTFFSLGVVPGVISSIIFAIPPTIRLTNLGIRQVPAELVEAADAFGSTPTQKLFKLQLPIAMPTIMAGINQTIMLSLSMVVIASMIGAQGVGAYVYRAVTQGNTGVGFEAGLAIVILAIILDRLTQQIIRKSKTT